MDSILSKVRVTEYPLFRTMAMRRCGWTKDQYKDRRICRTKLTPLERAELLRIIDELHDPEVDEMKVAKRELRYCNNDCIMFSHNRCVFTLDECPMYQLIKKDTKQQ